MFAIFLRMLWRFVILALGIGLAYLVAFIAYPYLNSELPFFFALLILYIAVAYFALPALIRAFRIFIRPNHIPLYSTTRDGLPSDPVNIAIVAKNKRHLIRSMKKAGWYTADKITLKSSLREAYAIIFNQPYFTAPFSTLYLFNRPFDVGFQIPYGKNQSPRSRHHVRFWQLVDQEGDNGHGRFWHRHFRRFIIKQRTVWIGCATDDTHSAGIRWYNLQLTHRNNAHHYRERDFIIKTLETQKLIKATSEIKAGEPFHMRSQNIGIRFVCDGRLTVIEIA